MGDWKKNVRAVTPYVPGDQPQENNMIKINTNENPYPPAPGVTRVLRELPTEKLRLYPQPDSKPLVEAIANEYQVSPEQIFVGVGSDDVLGMAFLTCFSGKQEILFPDITYSFYPVWADLFRIPYRQIPVNQEFRICKEDYFVPNGGIVIANPNAPTSIAENRDWIEDILRHNQDSVVIIDEAYIDFGGETSLPLVKKYDNLLVVQTFSKSRSMAGMRIGFAIGNKQLISAINAVRNSYNSYTMNTTAIYCGVEAVKDRVYFEETRHKIMATREWTEKKLTELGFYVLPSSTSFLFASLQDKSANDLFEHLKSKHIYVRHFNHPRIQNYLRISIGTQEQMEIVIKEIKEWMKN